MSSTQRLVTAKQPTILAHRTHVDLPGYDVFLHCEHVVLVIPAKLDVPKFEEALSRTLQVYPHCTGQLRCTDRRWFIELTNTAVPVDIEYKNTGSDSVIKGDWVVQDDITSLLSHLPEDVQLVNGPAPLVRWKLTFFDNETTVGCTWQHSLGDATMTYRCVHTLSQFYQGLSSQYPTPMFDKHFFPTPSHSLMTKFLPRVPYLHPSRVIKAEDFILSHMGFHHVRWQIKDQDLAELRTVLSSKRRDGPFLSRQDCLVAYIVAVLNHNRNTSVKHITNILGCRDVSTSCHKDSASNIAVDVTAEVPQDMAGIAYAFRDAIIESRKPEYIDTYLTLSGDSRLEAANEGKISPYAPDDDALLVNLLTGLDWCGAHFGYPEGTRVHISRMAKLLLACLRSNPVKGDDGVWRDRQSIEVSLGVPTGAELGVVASLSRGVKDMLNGERARL